MVSVQQNRKILQVVSWVGMMLLFLLTACVGGNSSNPNNGKNEPVPNSFTDTFQQKPLHNNQFSQTGLGALLRFLFIVDNSFSMHEEQDAIGMAAPTIATTITSNPRFQDLDMGFGVITTTTFGTADVTYAGTPYFNPNATADEIDRESHCYDPTDLNSGYYWEDIDGARGNAVGTYCAWNWRINGSQGNLRHFISPHDLQTYPNPTGYTVLTGRESNFAELITAALKVGVFGDWLESGAMALMQFLNHTGPDYDFMLDPNSHLAIIHITDVGDYSYFHANDGIVGNNVLDDSRDPNGPMDDNNPAWYTDLTTNFLTALQNVKASPSLLSFHEIGPVAPSATCHVEGGFNYRTRTIAQLLGGVTADICALSSFETILTDIVDRVTEQLNKLFNLNYHEPEPILTSSIVVTVNGAPVTDYSFVAPALISFDKGFVPPSGSDVRATYWGPKLTHWQLSNIPLEDTIVVAIVNDDGSKTVMSNNTWQYNTITNSIDFVDPATAPQASANFAVSYKPAAGER